MNKLETFPWDAADHLETKEDIAAYLEAALEDGDPALVAAVLGDIARSKGVTNIARETGLGRESLSGRMSNAVESSSARFLFILMRNCCTDRINKLCYSLYQ